MAKLSLVIVLVSVCLYVHAQTVVEEEFGGLYPRESPTREVKSLDGLWYFRLAPRNDPDLGFRETWYKQPLKLTGDTIRIPVPSSYNDVTTNATLRDHIGWAWYDRTFYIPKGWEGKESRIVIRIGSSHYNSILYLNGQEMMRHEVGHLPYGAEVTGFVNSGDVNRITICVNNTLTPTTIPQGQIIYKTDTTMYPEGYFTQSIDFDFFNYAGIHRSVVVHRTPKSYIQDIITSTSVDNKTGIIDYQVIVSSPNSTTDKPNCSVEVFDQAETLVANATGCNGQILIPDAKLWWPYMMDDNPGYLYTLKVKSDVGGTVDFYPQRVGIRTVAWNQTTVTLNGVPLYLKGCGKHEDFQIIGKGLNYPLIVKDFSLLKWLGANSFRTSHYPYAEEIMDMADEEGIMIIDESPAVNLKGFNDVLLSKHKTVMEAMIRRDANRPSVIMWSLANEPNSDQKAAKNYFAEIAKFTRGLDPSRPVTSALNADVSVDLAGDSLDVIMVNRYYSWYSDTGHVELIYQQTLTLFSRWHSRHKKPLLMSEYGAGTIPGLHMEPSFTWSEEYQARLLLENFKAFDELRRQGYFIGEMIWNFADFATDQGTTRVGGNKKGIFTRSREPKMGAHVLRRRYSSLGVDEVPGQKENICGNNEWLPW